MTVKSSCVTATLSNAKLSKLDRVLTAPSKAERSLATPRFASHLEERDAIGWRHADVGNGVRRPFLDALYHLSVIARVEYKSPAWL